MDESSANDRNWLDDRLQAVEGSESGFTVVNSPLRPVVERGDPWKVDVRHHELKAFLEPLEAGADGEARVAIMTDVEEDPVARVQTAVLLARRLAEQGRRVLLVDADVRHVGLSRWLPDRDLDAEGLVDVLQYGASVPALQRPGPVDGVHVLAVGSYRPDDASLFAEDEVLRLMGQLRTVADVVLLLAPAWVTDERFHPLLVHGDAVVVSLHLDRTLGPRLQELLQYLGGLNVPVAGVMTFAGPDAAERHVDDVFDGNEADGVLGEANPPAPRDEPLPAPPPEPEPAAPEADAVAARPETRPRAIEPPADDDGGSSRVFRIAAVVSLVVIVAFVGWWGLSSQSDDSGLPIVTGRPPVDDVATGTAAETASEGTDAPAEITSGETIDPQAADDTAADAPDTPTEAATNEASDVTTAEATEESPAVTSPEPTPATPEQVADDAIDAPAAWEQAVALAPGGGGYALHVSSFSRSEPAATEVARLQRTEGWNPIVREATVDGRQWYRVLVGRFPTRAEALAARDAVGEIVEQDWIGVIRVP